MKNPSMNVQTQREARTRDDQPALATRGGLCPTEKPEVREGWPPLPGSYTILRYRAPVAVCTLTSHDLAVQIVQAASETVSRDAQKKIKMREE